MLEEEVHDAIWHEDHFKNDMEHLFARKESGVFKDEEADVATMSIGSIVAHAQTYPVNVSRSTAYMPRKKRRDKKLNAFVTWDNSTIKLKYPLTPWKKHKSSGKHSTMRWSLFDTNNRECIQLACKHFSCFNSPFKTRKKCEHCSKPKWRKSCLDPDDLYFIVINPSYGWGYENDYEELIKPFISKRKTLTDDYIDIMRSKIPPFKSMYSMKCTRKDVDATESFALELLCHEGLFTQTERATTESELLAMPPLQSDMQVTPESELLAIGLGGGSFISSNQLVYQHSHQLH